MPKPGFTLVILVSLYSLCLEVSIEAQSRETKPETATISGLVTLKGEPARGVTVLLREQMTNTNKSPRDKTDENGRFRFTGVAAGKYSISALAPGYVSLGDSDMGRGGQALNVAEGEKIENISLEIRRGGVIAGSVTDSRGRPVVEETVELYKLNKDGKPQNYRSNNSIYEMYRTDDRGAYRIFGVPEGRYLVSVGRREGPGSVGITSGRLFYPRAYHPGVTSESEAKVVDVSEGSEATDVDIKLPEPKRTCEISGRVIDAQTGQPVAGVGIVVGSVTPDGRPIGRGVWSGLNSATNGEFRLTVLPGKYALDLEVGAGFLRDPVILNVEGDVEGVEIKFSQGASISGVAVIEGTNDPKILSKLSQVYLYISLISRSSNSQSFEGRGAGMVYADGKFHIRGLQAGKYHISSSRSASTEGLVLARIEHNGAVMRDGIDIEAGQQLTGVRVVLVYSTLKIRGELKIVGGAAPDGARFYVMARRVDSRMQEGLPSASAEVDARGQFVIENVLPGEYEINVTPSYTPNSERLDVQTMMLISSFKERVVVASDNPQPIVLVVDLSRKEGNR